MKVKIISMNEHNRIIVSDERMNHLILAYEGLSQIIEDVEKGKMNPIEVSVMIHHAQWHLDNGVFDLLDPRHVRDISMNLHCSDPVSEEQFHVNRTN